MAADSRIWSDGDFTSHLFQSDVGFHASVPVQTAQQASCKVLNEVHGSGTRADVSHAWDGASLAYLEQSGCVSASMMPLAVAGKPKPRVSVFDRLSEVKADGMGQKGSYVAAVSGDAVQASVSRQPNVALQFFPPEELEPDVVRLPVKLIEDTGKFGRTIVGYFLQERAGLQTIIHSIKQIWSKHGLQEVTVNHLGFLFFTFASKEGAQKVLEHPYWMIHGLPLFVKLWTSAGSVAKDVHHSCPTWVKLFDIPRLALSNEGIGRIASMLGVPIRMDVPTAAFCDHPRGRLHFARVLVDVAACGKPKYGIRVAIPELNGEYGKPGVVRVEYSSLPPQCSHCKCFGHDLKGCAFKPSSSGVGLVDADGFQAVKSSKPAHRSEEVRGAPVVSNVNTEVPLSPTEVSRAAVAAHQVPVEVVGEVCLDSVVSHRDVASGVSPVVQEPVAQADLGGTESHVSTPVVETTLEVEARGHEVDPLLGKPGVIDSSPGKFIPGLKRAFKIRHDTPHVCKGNTGNKFGPLADLGDGGGNLEGCFEGVMDGLGESSEGGDDMDIIYQ